jgi:hypothetical protein
MTDIFALTETLKPGQVLRGVFSEASTRTLGDAIVAFAFAAYLTPTRCLRERWRMIDALRSLKRAKASEPAVSVGFHSPLSDAHPVITINPIALPELN